MVMVRALVWALALVLLAGCLGDGEDPVPPVDDMDVYAPLRELLADVPCEASAVETSATSQNLLEIAHLPYDLGDHAELDLQGHLAVHSTYSADGFDLVDVRDPARPQLLSTFVGAAGTVLDVKLHPDRSTVFNGVPDGVDIIDVRDPSTPVKTGEWRFPPRLVFGEAHMLYLYEMDGQTFLFVATADNNGVLVLEVLGEPGAYELHPLGTVGGGINGPIGPHDMWATYDEALEAHVLYIANGFMGWLAYDIGEPSRPKLLGGSPNPDTHQGYIHTIQAAWVDDRRLVVTVSEVGVNAMRVFDATDLQAPVLVASWQSDNPARLQHNLQIVDDRLFFSHYGLGVFGFDLTTVGTMAYGQLLQMVPVAHYAVPNSSWDVVVRDGLLYIGDDAGLDVVGYGCWTPGDPLLASTG